MKRPPLAFLITLSVLLPLSSVLLASDPLDRDHPAGAVDKLIQDLGSSEFAIREAASRRLAQMGKTPLEPLRKAAVNDDPEVRRRAEDVLLFLSRRMSKTVQALALSAPARQVLLGSTGHEGSIAWVRELATDKDVMSFTAHEGRLGRGALSRNGQTALTTGFGASEPTVMNNGDCTIRLWDLRIGRLIQKLEGHTWPVNGVAFSPNERLAVSCSSDQTARVWDLDSGKEVCCFTGHQRNGVYQALFSPKGDLAASGGLDGSIRIWNPVTGAQESAVSFEGSIIHSLAFSPDGRQIACGSGNHRRTELGADTATDCLVRVWRIGSNQKALRLEGHEEYVTCLCFFPDGKRLASGARDGSVRVWDLESGKESKCFRTKERIIMYLAINPDGRSIATLANNGVFETFEMPR
jgi:WD40 repeat protein